MKNIKNIGSMFRKTRTEKKSGWFGKKNKNGEGGDETGGEESGNEDGEGGGDGKKVGETEKERLMRKSRQSTQQQKKKKNPRRKAKVEGEGSGSDSDGTKGSDASGDPRKQRKSRVSKAPRRRGSKDESMSEKVSAREERKTRAPCNST